MPSRRMRAWRGNQRNKFTIAEDAAQRMFVAMLLSDWRLTIAQCCQCQIYFLLKHWNRTYRTGTRCPGCIKKRRQVSAGTITVQVRRQAEQQLYQLAARRFAKRILKTPAWQKQAIFKADIAEYLNLQIQKRRELQTIYYAGGRNGITGKWLAHSKNWNGIEQAIKRGSDAKS